MAKTVLILDGQTVQAIHIARSLKKSGYKVILSCNDKTTYGYHTKYADRKVLCPVQFHDEAGYLEFIVEFLRDNKVDVILPMNDNSAMFLSRNKTLLSQYARFLIPDEDIFMQAHDKNRLMALCMEYGFPHPETVVDLDESGPEKARDRAIFPAILKPNMSSGVRGMKIVSDYGELERIYGDTVRQYGKCHLQKFIKPGGRQIKVQLFVDGNGAPAASSVIHKIRYYPEKGGSSCFNVTISDDRLVDTCYRMLKQIGWHGFADFDMIEDPDDGVVKIMEINPRIPACIGSALASGIDYGTLIVDASLGRQLKKYTYRPGHSLRHLGFDILWFIYSPNRFKCRPGWFRFVGKGLAYQDFSWRDPKPFIFGTYGNLKKQLNPGFRKSKSGTR